MAKHLRTKRNKRYHQKLLFAEDIRVGDLFLYSSFAGQPSYIIRIDDVVNNDTYYRFHYCITNFSAKRVSPPPGRGNFTLTDGAHLASTWKLAKPREIQRIIARGDFKPLT